MPLAAGTRLGAFEILAPLGKGGMGEVYRARDTKLGRDVAVKILPSELAADSERLARFRREAHLLASLNHPNIASIYGLEDADGKPFLVLELVDGEELSERLTRGAIPVEESLEIARQIAEALEEAHEHGIVHRDLKPANIKLTPDGKVKVLDFGLAKAYAADEAEATDESQSPTMSARATAAGLLLGTAAYMSPEQARGKPVDKRADIWAFGVVLLEMLTGKRLFTGETVSDTLASILKEEPDWTLLPVDTPRKLSDLLHRCMRKDVRNRLHDIGDARIEIEEAIDGGADEASSVSLSTPASLSQRAFPWVAGALAIALGLFLLTVWRQPSPSPTTLRFEARLSPGVSLGKRALLLGPAAVLSPNGDLLAFVGQEDDGPSRIYTRRPDRLEALPLLGTEGGVNPFFSPDGQWIAFFADQRLKRVSVSGGAAITLCDASGGDGRGGTWGPDGTILFGSGRAGVGLSRVSAEGGASEPFTKLNPDAGDWTHRWPQWLPGRHAVLYTALGGLEGHNVVIETVSDGPRKVVVRGGYHGRYLPSGHLVFVRQGTLYAAPFDLDTLETTGAAVPTVEGVRANRSSAAAQFSISEDGTFLYVAGEASWLSAPIHWLSRDGTTKPLRPEPAYWEGLRFSPTGDRLTMMIHDDTQWDVWVYDWLRAALSRLTFDPGIDWRPVWTPDGRRIVFSSSRSGQRNLWWRRSDGSGDAERLTEGENAQFAYSWHPRGRVLMFRERRPDAGYDLMTLEVEGDEETGWKPGTPAVFLSTPFDESSPMFSPDGRWLAYQSDESGRQEVYVQPFPGPGKKSQVSTGGGVEPKWSRTRPELFYGSPDGTIMVARYTVEADSFHPGQPTRWSDAAFVLRPNPGGFDLHPDGQRFALLSASDTQTAEAPDTVVFITNFFDELRRLTEDEGR